MVLRRSRPEPVDLALAELQRVFAGRIGWSATLPALPAEHAMPARPFPPELRELLRASATPGLYPHQAAAFDALDAGQDVLIATPTASGKTLAFALPIFARLLREPAARALLVVPTNGLANDQLRGVAAYAERLPRAPRVAVFTGATDEAARRALRAAPPSLLITNPEMLHLSLVGQHRLWQPFWSGLRFLALDELHLYRGVFGAHMALLVRRALRVAALHGSEPQLIGCSATVGNPEELGERLTGRRMAIVRGAGAARGARTVATMMRMASPSASQALAVELFGGLVERGIGTILFTLTRRDAELMSGQAREHLGPALARAIAPYRGGLDGAERERIEADLKSGRLRGVVATNALEVGIDIGGLDAAVIAGFPGSRASFWQQAGRAGRGERPSLVLFVPYPRALDAYYASHADALLAGVLEAVAIDRQNEQVLVQHLACAAAEAPLDAAALRGLGRPSDASLRLAIERGALLREGRCYRAGPAASHARVNLRGASDDRWTIVEAGREIGTIDEEHRGIELHNGAVYLHGGRRYRVAGSDAEARTVVVRREPDDLLTEPIVYTVAAPLSGDAAACAPSRDRTPCTMRAGRLRIMRSVAGYREGRRTSRERKTVTLDPAERREFETFGLWFVFAEELRARLDAGGRRRFAPALHALEHLLPAAAALRVLCDPRDLVASFEERHEALGGAALFLYDAVPGGCGIAERLSADAAALLALCLQIVSGCPCREGCPACVLAAACRRPADPPDKAAALELLRSLGV